MISNFKKIIIVPIDLITLFVLWGILMLVKVNSFFQFILKDEEKIKVKKY